MMRGGTSKGPFFLAGDLPADIADRNQMLLTIMGSPDARQIDGMGGAHPLTSKVVIVSPSKRDDSDVDYLFLQVSPETGAISDSQNCGNMLAGVGPFAIERGLVEAVEGETIVRVYMVNSSSQADLVVQTPEGKVTYEGDAHVDGVPGTHAPILQNYFGTAGAQCGALLPTGNEIDLIDGIECTLVDNGMPSVLLRAKDFGLSGYETPATLEANAELKTRLEAIRLKAGVLMNLGDVSDMTIPKMCLIAPPQYGGIVTTRTFIPHRVHQAVGVLAAASDAAGCMFAGGVAAGIAEFEEVNPCRVDVEHPTGALTVELAWKGDTVVRTALLRTARKLMDGLVFL
ncbi:FldA protein [Litorimonas cladophorae]|uniref:FldA protein n=2 Tax=Litorimonas cladophorae TaxID=1220491 RepID=A0A918KH39_9PROT|nr:FldA protein [Litorimonas cladophorae]